MSAPTEGKRKEGAQPGNKNATKNRPWRDAIDRAIKQANFGKKEGHDVLRIIASMMLKDAMKRKPWAVKEISERLDGKVVQEIAGANGGDIIVRLAKGDEEA